MIIFDVYGPYAIPPVAFTIVMVASSPPQLCVNASHTSCPTAS